MFYLLLLVSSAHFFQIFSECFIGIDAEVEYFEKYTSLPIIFFVSVIIAPMLETLIFQWLVYKIFRSLNINKLIYMYFTSALLFGMIHTYNIFTIMDAIVAGLIFIHYFHINNKESSNGYMHVTLLHACFNFHSSCSYDLTLLQFYAIDEFVYVS